MKKLVNRLIKRALGLVPLGAYQRVMRRAHVGFVYHAVSDGEMPHVRSLYQPVPAARFENSLRYLKTQFNPVTYQQLHAYVTAGAPLPRNAVHLSFDDGFAECFTVVRPLLLKHGIPCIFFVTTDWIDNQQAFYRNKVSLCIAKLAGMDAEEARAALAALDAALGTAFDGIEAFKAWILPLVRADEPIIDRVCALLEVDAGAFVRQNQPYLTTRQIEQMAQEGFTIGSHTRSHPKLVQVSAAEMETEIVESSRIVQDITGDAIVPFAFPNSATGIDRTLLESIRARHPFLGLFFDTKGVRQDTLINRVWAERRGFEPRGDQTNLPRLLHVAYQEQAYENVLDVLRRRRAV